ncbi:hypothetical protein FGADI_8742 [Fusarium gaditjirri]|uniref:Uncharacterized protein n=1 Tax=Fusarium gaditjirri TaxID=282569 RepID=A0A8H4T1V4_9HYPO|nr:hypothetical protein FGADI_8742 [Fusarium gaditjirri]
MTPSGHRTQKIAHESNPLPLTPRQLRHVDNKQMAYGNISPIAGDPTNMQFKILGKGERSPKLLHNMAAAVIDDRWPFSKKFRDAQKLSRSLARFTHMVRDILGMPGGFTLGMVRIELDMFRMDGLRHSTKMSWWERISHPHGYKEGARRHVTQWMDNVEVLQALDITVGVNLRMRMPYRDYVVMRVLTKVLRQSNVEPSVTLPQKAWKDVPEKYRSLLIGMVDFAITGTQLRRTLELQRVALTTDEERTLIEHGCITVQSLRIIHERHDEDLYRY